jgi:hypothetical protein
LIVELDIHQIRKKPEHEIRKRGGRECGDAIEVAAIPRWLAGSVTLGETAETARDWCGYRVPVREADFVAHGRQGRCSRAPGAVSVCFIEAVVVVASQLADRGLSGGVPAWDQVPTVPREDLKVLTLAFEAAICAQVELDMDQQVTERMQLVDVSILSVHLELCRLRRRWH